MAVLPSEKSNILCVEFDNAVQDGDLCLAQLLVALKNESAIRDAFAIPGRNKQVRAGGLLVQSQIKLLTDHPSYTNLQARLAAASVVAGKPGVEICGAICPNPFLARDLAVADGIAYSGSDTWGMDVIPSPGFYRNISVTVEPRIRAIGVSGFLELKKASFSALAQTAAVVSDVVTYTDGGAQPLPQQVILAFEVDGGNSQGDQPFPFVGDGSPPTALPGPTCAQLDNGATITLKLASGDTKVFTLQSGVDWRGATGAGLFEQATAFVYAYCTDDGELLYAGGGNQSFYHADSWLETKVGGTKVMEFRKESNVKTIDTILGASSQGTLLSYEEACLINLKL